jgi:8-oxo-dGTP pyrophosphatase MutT (NUDIX family)
MKNVLTAGGIVMQGQRVRLIHSKKGGYNIPKGHVEPGETVEEAAMREVAEETGITVRVVRKLGLVQRESMEDDGRTVVKDIELFLMAATGEYDGELQEESSWVELDDAIGRMRHPEEAAFLRAVHDDLLADSAAAE